MRILVLSIEYPPLGGGASSMSHELNKNYLSQGHEVEVVTMGFKDLPSYEILDGVHIHRVSCLRAKKHMSNPAEHLSFLIESRKLLRKLLPDRPFDICHTHFILPTGLLARWVKRKFSIPYIITAHGSDVPGFNPHRFTFLHRFTKGMIRKIIHSSSAIVSPSQYLASLIIKASPDAEKKIHIIPNGINISMYTPGDKKPMILSSGRLLERKGFHHLINAVSNEKLGYQLHIAGEGPMMDQLKKQAEQSLTPVTFHGWLDNRDTAFISLLESASIFCLMSTHENASTSLLEGLASGCAVVTTNVSGCPETVGNAGVCLPPGNVEILSSTLKEIIADDPYRHFLMHAARNRSKEVFDWPVIATKYLDVLSSSSSEMSRLKKDTQMTLLSRIPFMLLSFLSVVLLTRLLGPEGNGVYTYLFTALNLLLTLVGFQLESSLPFFLSNKQYENGKILSTVTFFAFVSILIFAIALTIIVFFVPDGETLFIPPGQPVLFFFFFLVISLYPSPFFCFTSVNLQRPLQV